jgi:uncharacterized protein YraI
MPPGSAGVSVGRCVPVQGYAYPWCEIRQGCLAGWSYSRYLVDRGGNPPGGAIASTAPSAPAGTETFRVTGVASNDFLMLRQGPGTNFPIVRQIPPTAGGVSVGSCQSVVGYRTKWCQAAWQGASGWASACCLTGERTGRLPD